MRKKECFVVKQDRKKTQAITKYIHLTRKKFGKKKKKKKKKQRVEYIEIKKPTILYLFVAWKRGLQLSTKDYKRITHSNKPFASY